MGTAGGFLVEVTVLLFLFAIHPFTIYPMTLKLLALLRPRPLRRVAPIPRSAALCVCAYNEVAVIRDKVMNMLAMQDMQPALELFVYVDAATDGTAGVLADIEAQFPNRMTVVVAHKRQGKTQGMNTLVGLTDAEIIAFSDANVAFDSNAMPNLMAPFADPDVGAVCGQLVYTDCDNETARAGSLYWRLEEHIKDLESATGSVMGADGSIFAIRRALHHAPPPDLIDDMYVSLSVLCDGARIVRAPGAIAYEEPVSRRGEEFARRTRIACQAFNVHRALVPRLHAVSILDKYKYVSHKLLRWLAGYLLAFSMLSGIAAVGMVLVAAGESRIFALFLLALVVFAVAVSRARHGALASLHDILGAFVASALGVARALRGEHFQTWVPPASARSRMPEEV